MKAENRNALAIAFVSIALLGLPGLQGIAGAQTAVTRIAYDQCWADAVSWDSFCYIGTVVDGHDALLANGLGPKWSPDGSKIAFTGASDPDIPYYVYYSDPAEILVWNAADGSITNLSNHPAHDWGPSWSRDGGKIAFASNRDGTTELYVMEATGANPTRLTYDVGFTGTFAWSPDGGRFAFTSEQDGWPELYVINADGSNLTRLTNDVGFVGAATWSPDGSRIAFDCSTDGGADICAVHADGSNFVRLTSDPARDSGAAFSPVDGRIAFVTERFGAGPEIAVMEPDATVTRLLAGTGGTQPTWSPDGRRLTFVGTLPSFWTGVCYVGPGAHSADDFCGFVYGMYVVNADGSGLTTSANGANPNWFASLPGQPVAALTSECSGATCDFDAGGSFDPDGTIASYHWRFGDGTSDSGPVAHHAFAAPGPHAVTLTVTDDGGTTGVVRVPVLGPPAPVASFTVTCSGPACTFDASGSSDPDGTVTTYFWSFGDGGLSTGRTVTHAYDTGTFSPRLTVFDDTGQPGTALRRVSVVNASPTASFTVACSGPTCTFDGSASSDPDGTIASYVWYLGDGQIRAGRGAHVTYTYHTGTFAPRLIVSDNSGVTGSASASVTVVNATPVATFTSTCNGRTCTFDGSGSYDPDGTITRYTWSFGDGTWAYSGGGAGLRDVVSHTFAAARTYTVTLYVEADVGTAYQSHTVTVGPGPG